MSEAYPQSDDHDCAAIEDDLGLTKQENEYLRARCTTLEAALRDIATPRRGLQGVIEQCSCRAAMEARAWTASSVVVSAKMEPGVPWIYGTERPEGEGRGQPTTNADRIEQLAWTLLEIASESDTTEAHQRIVARLRRWVERVARMWPAGRGAGCDSLCHGVCSNPAHNSSK